jgi:hypothetical protein
MAQQEAEWDTTAISSPEYWDIPEEGDQIDVVVTWKKGVHPEDAIRTTYKNITSFEVKNNCVVLNGGNIVIPLSAVVSIQQVKGG